MKNKFLNVTLLMIIIGVVLFYITAQFIQPSPKKEITIATGSKSGQYYETALKYKELLEKEKVKVNIINTSGSIENLELVQSNKVDIAFVQNGSIKNSSNIEALASVYNEPLWIFYNKKLHDVEYIKDLNGKKISIGEAKSGTEDLSLEVLKTNGINNENSKLLNLNTIEAKEALISGKIDAMFLVTSSNNKILKELLQNKDINLFSFRRANAYSKKFTYLNSVNLYEGTVNLHKNLPNEDKRLLATTALLVTHNEFSDELIRIFIKKVKEAHSQKGMFEKENEFPTLSGITIPINEEAQRYFTHGDTWLEKIFPYWIASNLDRLKILLIPLITLMIPIFKGIFPLYRWSIRSKIYRWYDELQALDLSLEGLSKEELKDKLNDLEKLKKEIKDETKVPLAYMGEYYDLIMHIELIISKSNIRIQSE
jgi:TRAP transporter TAXI family solute receptor